MIIDVWVCVIVFVCSNVGASLCLVPCSFSAVCVPFPAPARLPCVRFGAAACPRSGIELVLLLHCSQLASSGSELRPPPSHSLSLSSSHFMIFQATYPFAFHLLIYQRLMSS